MDAMNKKLNVGALCQGAAVAGLYAALTLLLIPISFGTGGAFQLRISEALTLLPCLLPASVPGLFVGCLLANLLAGAPLYDVIFGSLATLIAALLTHRFRKNIYLAAAMPVIVNTVIVGSMLAFVYELPYFYALLTVLPGEAAACFLLGIPMVKTLEKTKLC